MITPKQKKSLELHHMISICMGGDNSDFNLVYLCKKCHKQVTKYQHGILKGDGKGVEE